MAYKQTANRTIERSPNVAAILADYRDQQACQESLRRRRERACRVVETAERTRTYSKDEHRVREK